MTTNTLRIVHCVRSPIGGIFRHIRDLAECQADQGHEVGLICDSSTGSTFDNALLDELRPRLSLGIGRFPMKRQLSVADVKAAHALYNHVRDLKPDVIHGHGAKGGAYSRIIGSILRGKGQDVTRLYSPHGGSLHYDPNRIEGRVYHTLERLFCRMTDGLVFVSDYERAAFESKVCVPSAPSRVVYNGLKPEEFSPVSAGEEAADFLFIGMLRDLKGTDLFIEALNNIKLATGTAPTARIVGEGPDEDRYRRMVQTYGLEDKVTFQGALAYREALRLAKTVVVPSRAEAMPYIVLETIAAERPLIATRVGGIPEVFGKYSDKLVEPGHLGGLTAAMLQALSHPQDMARTAKGLRSCLAETFSAELMSERITDLYKELRGHPVPGNDTVPDTAVDEVASHTQSYFAKTR